MVSAIHGASMPRYPTSLLVFRYQFKLLQEIAGTIKSNSLYIKHQLCPFSFLDALFLVSLQESLL
jgi:hypothetical protein